MHLSPNIHVHVYSLPQVLVNWQNEIITQMENKVPSTMKGSLLINEDTNTSLSLYHYVLVEYLFMSNYLHVCTLYPNVNIILYSNTRLLCFTVSSASVKHWSTWSKWSIQWSRCITEALRWSVEADEALKH